MELLDYLSDLLGCNYLSDLRYIRVTPEHIQAILAVPDSRFPLEQYHRALAYLSPGESLLPDSLDEARRALTGLLERQSIKNDR